LWIGGIGRHQIRKGATVQGLRGGEGCMRGRREGPDPRVLGTNRGLYRRGRRKIHYLFWSNGFSAGHQLVRPRDQNVVKDTWPGQERRIGGGTGGLRNKGSFRNGGAIPEYPERKCRGVWHCT